MSNLVRPILAGVAPFLVLGLSGCSGGGGGGGLSSSPQVSTYDVSVPKAWFEQLYVRVKGNQNTAGTTASTNPPKASRVFGCAGVALYEALRPGMSDHVTLQGQLNGLPEGAIPEPVNARHHWPTVANSVLAAMARSFFVDADSVAAIDGLEDQFLTSFEADESQAVIDRSVQYGQDVAAAVITWMGDDGSVAAETGCVFAPPIGPSEGGWEPIAPATGLGLLPCWGDVRCFGLVNSAECVPFGAPAYSEDPTSEFYGYALLVYNVGESLTTEQTTIGQYWNDAPSSPSAMGAGTPPGHWMSITGIVLENEGRSLDAAAEAYARVGIALADAFYACWQTKFETYIKRPRTYVNQVLDDAIPAAATWTPLIGTPNFPTYTSGHSTQSGAAATVLMDFFGPVDFVDTTHSTLNPELGFTDRSFTSFIEAANEAAISRLYGGIHYTFDNVDGVTQGSCIGALHNQRLNFRD